MIYSKFAKIRGKGIPLKLLNQVSKIMERNVNAFLHRLRADGLHVDFTNNNNEITSIRVNVHVHVSRKLNLRCPFI